MYCTDDRTEISTEDIKTHFKVLKIIWIKFLFFKDRMFNTP